ncbi:hypothetical protein [Peribacillus butanolivorans]|uniref:hypothetical protein n=1 Tax=Peribacillus butanolivorans TaxID=421767 RepID=UPI00366A58AA
MYNGVFDSASAVAKKNKKSIKKIKKLVLIVKFIFKEKVDLGRKEVRCYVGHCSFSTPCCSSYSANFSAWHNILGHLLTICQKEQNYGVVISSVFVM